MHRRLSICVLLALAFSALAQAVSPSQVDALFADYDHPDVPGASVAIIQNGKIEYAHAYGRADLENQVAAQPRTNYRLASLTKQFTAMAIMILIEQGQLRLDTRLTDVFPDFPAYGKQITIRHLLGHQSGLKDYEDLIPSDQTGQLSDQDVLQIYRRQNSTDFTPGSRYRYCNGGYVLLGLVVAATAHQSFASFLKDHVFKPLGMAHTVAFENGISTVSDRAYGYSPRGSGFERTDQSVTSATLGDGGVYTSVEELFLWDQSLYRSPLISAGLLDQAFTAGVLNDGSRTGYGFGWMLDTYRGLHRQHHTGSTIGFRTSIARFPERAFTVVVLVNRANASPWDLGDRITDLYLFDK
jgi:CubicO group peptidase (beta-lactamase class C family)